MTREEFEARQVVTLYREKAEKPDCYGMRLCLELQA